MNTLNGNSFYIDTAFVSSSDDLVRSQVLVAYILVTSTAANGIITLGDVGASSTFKKLEIRIPEAGKTELLRFAENPILFPSGIRVLSLTNTVATVIIKNPGG